MGFGLAGLATDYGVAVEDANVNSSLADGTAEAPPSADSSESGGAGLGDAQRADNAAEPTARPRTTWFGRAKVLGG